jgi:hypothetical protein
MKQIPNYFIICTITVEGGFSFLCGMLYVEVERSLMGMLEVGCCIIKSIFRYEETCQEHFIIIFNILHGRRCCNCEPSDVHC